MPEQREQFSIPEQGSEITPEAVELGQKAVTTPETGEAKLASLHLEKPRSPRAKGLEVSPAQPEALATETEIDLTPAELNDLISGKKQMHPFDAQEALNRKLDQAA